MCKVYRFVKMCPNHEDGPVDWAVDWDLTAKSTRCRCRLVRRREWGSCPNFDRTFAKSFKNDRDIRFLHCDECLKVITGRLKRFREKGGWGRPEKGSSDYSSAGSETLSEDSSDYYATSIKANGIRTV